MFNDIQRSLTTICTSQFIDRKIPMKKVLVVFAFYISLTYSQQLSTNFSDYSNSTIEGQFNWVCSPTSGSGAVISNSSPLSYSGFGSNGNYAEVSTSASVVTFTNILAAPFVVSATSTIYYSLLVNVQSASSGGGNCFALDGGSGFARIWIDENLSGKWRIGISKNSTSLVWGLSTLNYNQTYLIVVRYTLNTGTLNDEAYVWVNPPLTGEPNIISAEVSSGSGQTQNSVTQCNGVILYLKNLTAAWKFDDLRVGYGTTSANAFSDLNYDNAMPVEIEELSATSALNSALLTWKTSNEINNYGFEIQRSSNSPVFSRETNKWEKVGFINGSGTSNSSKEYSFKDNNLDAGKYSYRLKQIDRNGKFEYSKMIEVNVSSTPSKFELAQNYPNPFNPVTTIGFSLQTSGTTTLRIFDIIGKHVATLVNEKLVAGVRHQRTFDASKLSSGIYFAKLTSEGKSQTRKLVLIK